MMKLYAIEWLRVIFVFVIVLGHCMQAFPEISPNILNFLDSKAVHTGFGVEYFFIISGFFLFRHLSKTQKDIFTLLRERYLRLFPAMLFLFILCVILKIANINRLPMIIAFLQGMSLPGEAIGWGDWYVGVYFWCMTFYIALFISSPKQAFLIMLVVMYFSLCIKFNAPYPGFVKTYNTIIGSEILRGLYSIGMGILAAFLSEKITFCYNKVTMFFFTIIELACLYVCIHYLLYRSPASFLEAEILFAILLISISKSAGFISTAFNKLHSIYHLSKYTYQFFLMHSCVLKFLLSHTKFGLSNAQSTVAVFMGGVLLSVIEYNIFEKKTLPYIKQFFIKKREI